MRYVVWFFLLLSLVASASAQPTLAENGALNAASFQLPALPGGSIAQGSIFTLFGSGLGSTAGAALEFPLETTLAGISIQVTQGNMTVDAIPLFSNGAQINAVMPSNAPMGEVEITVTLSGQTSNAISAQVVMRSVGIFTALGTGFGPGIVQNFESQELQPLNSLQTPARPGQVVTLWGTGLGPIAAPDNEAPPVGNLTDQLEILVGGVPAETIRYAGRSPQFSGLDQIVFDIPEDAPIGCYVPVELKTTDNNMPSNSVTVATKSDATAGCEDILNPAVSMLFDGSSADTRRLGTLALSQTTLVLQTAPGQQIEAVSERAIADFEQVNAFYYDMALALPPVGSCLHTGFPGPIPLGTDFQDLVNLRPVFGLDAGGELALTRDGDGEMKTIALASPGSYRTPLGGGLPFPGQPPVEPPFLTPGAFTLSGSGGTAQDGLVGAFSASLEFGSSFTWDNFGSFDMISRSEPLELRWSGGDPSTQVVLIAGASVDNEAQAAGAFNCIASVDAGEFAVPVHVLESVPASTPTAEGFPGGFFVIGVVSYGEPSALGFTADGLDRGVAQNIFVTGSVFPYR